MLVHVSNNPEVFSSQRKQELSNAAIFYKT